MRKMQAVKNIHSMLAALKSEKKSEWLQILNAYFPTVTQHLLIPENTKRQTLSLEEILWNGKVRRTVMSLDIN